DTAQIEAGRYQLSRLALSVTSLLEEACSLLVMLTTEKNIELNCTSAQGLVIDADPERIFQVLSNLVGNAIKFTPMGRVKIALQAVDNPDPQLLHLHITVQD
ncbi:Bacteriophytochrome, partial [Pseudomonas syringae pv. maculicola]